MKREHLPSDDDAEIEALLREVGAGDQLSSADTEDIRRAVHDEWLSVVAQRKRRTRVMTFGVAASFAIVVLIASWILRSSVSIVELPVSIAYIDGAAQSEVAALGMKVGDDVAVGSSLNTDSMTRIALNVGTAVSMRIDRDTRIQRVANDRFRLSEGALYVDADPNAKDHDLIVETAAGDVRHLGTQYQVRQSNGVVEVSIREGRVQIESSSGAALASAGERVMINRAGEIQRQSISAQDAEWDWAERSSPPFALDDRTLAEFLQWVGRQTGRQVVYATPEAQAMAQALKLHGSIDGLDPDTALSAVLSTTEFVRYETGEDLIGVRLSPTDQSR